MLTKAWNIFLSILFPKRCVGCGLKSTFLCDSCRSQAKIVSYQCFVCERRSPDGTICEECKPETRLRRFFSPLLFREPIVRKIIHAMKYGGIREVAPILAAYIIGSLLIVEADIPRDAIIVPVPLHPRRLRKRGFNQAELIGREIAKNFELKLLYLLRRREHRMPQTQIARREDRIKNAEGLYEVVGSIPRRMTIILVDDVSTTGATLEECARVLKDAGAHRVWAITAART